MIDIRLLIKNGVHYGHQTSRWCPKMKPYIWGSKNGVHLIDVLKTAQQLEKAAQFLESVIAEGRTVLLVGTKKAAQESIYKIATANNLPYVMHRWVGGTFTNHRQVRKAISNLMNYEEVLEKSSESNYTKKELNLLRKRSTRLSNIVGGIRNLSWPVGAVVVVDVKKENVVVKEAFASGIPVVALVDTNCDPSHIDYVIPANDDSPRAISCLFDYLGEAIARGQKLSAKRPKKEQAVIETVVETLYDALADDESNEPTKRGSGKAKPKKVDVEREIESVKEVRSEPKNLVASKPSQQASSQQAAVTITENKSTEKPVLKKASEEITAHDDSSKVESGTLKKAAPKKVASKSTLSKESEKKSEAPKKTAAAKTKVADKKPKESSEKK